MRILITGADGFIGRNLQVRLREAGHQDVVCITRASTAAELDKGLAWADFVFHLAGVNRPEVEDEFTRGNQQLTERLCRTLLDLGRRTPLVFSSSTQATLENPYGRSKLAAEKALLQYSLASEAPLFIFRLANVFGKWARPNYNSVVATFCHNISRDLPIVINDFAAKLRLVHIDDVVEGFLKCLTQSGISSPFAEIGPVYDTTVGELADVIRGFAESRSTLLCPAAGAGLGRALYATYVSYLPVSAFCYRVPQYSDPRGSFAEVLKTRDCGQFSYFTARPGVTRGEHYHHSKTEKFVVIQGDARFRFRHIESGELHEIVVRGGDGTVVETVPGWAHDITNIGQDQLVVMLWANEVFDRARPDTIAMKVVP